MALKLYERYPQLWESPSNDYPQGAFKNLSAQGETDGSYLEKDWLNDYSGFFGALLRNAEMTPDGTIDTAQRSQFYDALIKVAKSAVADQGYATKTYVDNKFNEVPKTEIINDWNQASDDNVFSASTLRVGQRLNNQNYVDSSTMAQVDWANFPDRENRRQFVMHHYNDGDMAVWDNVGENNWFLHLRNARNPTRRYDKPEDFVGSADFIKMQNTVKRQNNEGYQAVDVLLIDKNGDMTWGNKNQLSKPVEFNSNQPFLTTDYSFKFNVKNSNNRHVLQITNAGNSVLSVDQTTDGLGAQWFFGEKLRQCNINFNNSIIKINTKGFFILAGDGRNYSVTDADGNYADIIRNIRYAPPTPTSKGVVGEIKIDSVSKYVYFCFLPNRWGRIKMEEEW